ncbi:MAG: Asp-tRNA(Asn)/Glu-tRNA(Gln) amidotransferase subunit GatC [Alphaproteobacteria bacterium GM7ARS4]|nr:Asp-tRNA(Asn)/Glu-tRNA(Gln) amidotransferase subunit GatC [Alphaproteobacteria bacterium GM7ARS4]
MPIDKHIVQHIAQLAKLDIEDKDIPFWQKNLQGIFAWIAQLDEVDGDSHEPLYGLSDHAMILQEDIVAHHVTREDILRTAPHTEDGFFIVPASIDPQE